MSKNKVNIDVKVDDKGTTKKVGLGAKNAGKGLDQAANSADNYSKKQKGVAGLTSNSTKAFSKMQQGTGGLVAAYATLAAQLFAISAAFNFLKQAGQLVSLQAGQAAYAAGTGTAMRTLAKDIIAATDAQVSFTDASQGAAIGIASGLSPEQLIRLSSAAKDVSMVLGRDVTDSYNRLIRGVTKAEPELLDELGIILRLARAKEAYGKIVNKNADDLTAFEATQAVTNEVLRQTEEKYSRILAITGGGQANQFAQLGHAFDEILDKLKEVTAYVAGPLATVLTKTPELVFAAIGLMLKPAVTAMIPGLNGVVERTKAVSDQAKLSFAEAQAHAENYQRALNKTRPGIDPRKHQAGLARVLAGQKAPQGSIMAQAQAGEQLNNRQIKALREHVAKKKLLHGKDLQNFKNHLKRMEQANTASNRKMITEYQIAMEQKKIATKRFEVFFKGSMAAVTTAASVAGRAMTVAFSAVAWIGLLYTLYQVVKEFMSSGEEAEVVANKYDHVKEKLSSVNEELEHFNAIQNVLNDTGKLTITSLDAIGKALGNISTNLFQTSADVIDRVLKDRVGALTMAGERLGELNRLQVEAQNYAKTGIAPKRYAGMRPDDRRDAMAKDSDRINELKQAAAGLQAIIQQTPADFMRALTPEILDTLEREREMIVNNADAKIAGSEVALRYVAAIDAIKAGTAENSKELVSSREAFKNLAAEVGTLTNINKLAADGFDDLRRKLFPKSEYANYLTTLEEQLRLSKLVKTNNLEEQASIDAKIASIGKEIALVKELRDQKLRHQGETLALGVEQTRNTPDIEFPGLKKRREELNKVANAELKLDQMREQAQLKRDMLQTVVNPTVAQLAEMNKINAAIFQQEDLVRRANLALTDGHKITQTMAGSIESNMTSAFAGLIDGTMTVKEAFASMAQGILKALAQVIAELITVKLLKMAIGMFTGPSVGSGFGGDTVDTGGTGNAGLARMSPDGFRNGGIAMPPKGYSAGGIASGSTSGYPAVLHGTEAVVPLPNGNSIPVEMKGAGNGTTNNNITVNVASDGQTTTQGGKGMDMDKMGAAVAAAVQKELQNQKRSGGILNPYGAA
ncbi:hypothetical protein N9033_00465 [bacterium]|nr:hypothetical protein [bacterium]MDB4464523.1 hypothetical protein [bacterium]